MFTYQVEDKVVTVYELLEDGNKAVWIQQPAYEWQEPFKTITAAKAFGKSMVDSLNNMPIPDDSIVPSLAEPLVITEEEPTE